MVDYEYYVIMHLGKSSYEIVVVCPASSGHEIWFVTLMDFQTDIV